MNEQPTVLVEWRKGWTSAAHTYLVEISNDTVWLGRLGNGGANWGTGFGVSDDMGRRAGRGSGGVVGGLGMSLGQAGARKVLDKYLAVIDENLRRYHLEGRAALSDDKHTTEWRLADLSDLEIVKRLPGTAPPAVQSLGPGFLAFTRRRKRHFFAAIPGGVSVEQFQETLLAAMDADGHEALS